MITRYSLHILFLSVTSLIFAQQQVGTWKFYGSQYNMQFHEVVGSEIYSGNEFGTFFKLNPATNEVFTLSQIDGFVDSRVTYLKYATEVDVLVVTYINGQIDLVKGNQIMNISDIFRNESISDSKRINHVTIYGSDAYLSTDFGVVVLDLVSGLIKDTYRFIGENGDELGVISSTINTDSDSLFICTDNRVQGADVNNNNLNDFNNWKSFEIGSGVPQERIVGLVNYDNIVYLAAGDTLFSLESGGWKKSQTFDTLISGIKQSKDNFCLSAGDSVFVFGSTNKKFKSSLFNDVKDASFTDGRLVVSDSKNGLVVDLKQRRYNSPQSLSAYRIIDPDGKLVVAPDLINEGMYVYDDYTWENRSSQDILGKSNIVDAAYSSVNDVTYYASMGSGLIRESMEGNYQNVGSAYLNQANDGNIYVSAVETDFNGNTWVLNYSSNSNDFLTSLFKINQDDDWIGYQIPSNLGRSVIDMKINESGYVFLLTTSATLLVFDPENGFLKTYLSNTANIPGRITCMDMSFEGDLILGTNSGISVGFSTNDIFNNDNYQFTRPIFGEGYLLGEESVNCLKFDGGDNLWVGTNNGVQYFNKDLDERLNFFSASNSPLVTSRIIQIGIDGQNGEVFMNTPEGLISYQGFATTTTRINAKEFNIFPNPVTPEYEGVVTVRGMAYDVNVKFTDTAGNIVFETDSEGGSAVWDLQLLSGECAVTGVYLVFTTDTSGEETYVGKIAVISP